MGVGGLICQCIQKGPVNVSYPWFKGDGLGCAESRICHHDLLPIVAFCHSGVSEQCSDFSGMAAGGRAAHLL